MLSQVSSRYVMLVHVASG